MGCVLGLSDASEDNSLNGKEIRRKTKPIRPMSELIVHASRVVLESDAAVPADPYYQY